MAEAIYTANTPIVSLRNSVFWANKMNGSSTVAGADFFHANTLGNNASYKNNALQLTSSSYALITHNELSASSANNIFAVSPKFTDSTDTDGADNLFRTQEDGLQLKSNSPCINAGITGTDIPATDMIGIARYSPDMGAYEYSICPATNVLYVDSSITISGNGSTWATAFKNLDTALYLAWQCPDVTAIYVAKGTYKPVHYPFKYECRQNRYGNYCFRYEVQNISYPYRAGTVWRLSKRRVGTRNITTNITRLSGDIDAARYQ